MKEFNNNEALLAKTWKVSTNKVNHKTKVLRFCHHTLRSLFPGLGATNDKFCKTLKNKQKIGLSVASSFEVTKGFEVGWGRGQWARSARCPLPHPPRI